MIEIPNKRGSIQKPAEVIEYNNGKTPLDLLDQMAAYSTPLRKSVKWHRKLAIELLLSTAVVNAYVLRKDITGKSIKIHKFRMDIAKALVNSKDLDAIKDIEGVVQRPKRVRHEMKRRDTNAASRKYCRRCYALLSKDPNKKAKNAKKVYTYCSGCVGEPAYCLDCFNATHRI